jgi:predicted permease
MTICAILILFLSRLFDFSKEVTGCLMLLAILGNTSFLGIPVVTSYMGEDSIPYIMVYDQLGNFIALATYGTFIANYYSSNSKVTFKLITYKVVTFPPFIALIIGLLLMGTQFNEISTKILESFSATIIPIALVSVGLQLQLKMLKSEIKPFSVAIIVKLIISPIIAIIACAIFGWNNTASTVSIMEAGMSAMISAGAIATMAGLAPKLSAAIVGYGTIISLFTTSILYFFIS